ncbi:MAG: arginine repressor [Oscillospiraceae bacterium]|jgi:transcriptional regulator of arginine metabolism|nr:arginine repressor [Oscillospiraceae bacterium]MBR6431071.1 arginine repressor [Oscillospiraceae bacterium]
MKNDRQTMILNIIAKKDIETQFQLLDELERAGIRCTQATVSRDIKQLHLYKELTPGGRYKYVFPRVHEIQNYSDRLSTIFKESITSFVSAQNIVVIKTLPGLAPAVCSALDGMNIRNLAGTLAGDDTAFLAMFDAGAAEELCREISSMLEESGLR